MKEKLQKIVQHPYKIIIEILLVAILFIISCSNPLEEIQEQQYSLVLSGGQYVEVPYDSTLDSLATGQFTIEAFVWTDTVLAPEHPAIISIGNPDGGEEIGVYRDRADSSNQMFVTIDAQPVPGVSGVPMSGIAIEDKKSYFVAVTFDSGQVDLFINGTHQLGGFLTDTTQIDVGAVSLLIGAGRSNGSVGNYWYGAFNEVRLWRTRLTNQEISFHYRNPEKLSENYTRDNPPYKNLIGLWRFNEGEGSTVHDGSKNSLDGVIIGGATWR